ncbi:MAG TPA: hypothetical protein ENN52_08880 [Methanofollis liminatans]|uniref:Uncharacterized protein n=1 Tax=Methanofollis liminatans TaxID=2201 RepID=A0A831M146_9EURY|nr:hypothetical protein [Methanofollis liminatans]
MLTVIPDRAIVRRTALLFLCVSIILCMPVLAAGTVVREVGPADAGGLITVTLSFSGMEVGGLTETLPEGFTYVDSSLPSSRVMVQDDQVCFCVINESTVTYRLRAPDQGSGEIVGTWWDFTARTNGTIPSSAIPSGGVETPAAPGPGVFLSLLALLAVPALRRWRR